MDTGDSSSKVTPPLTGMAGSVEYRDVLDVPKIRTNLFNNVLAAVKSTYPISNGVVSLHLENPRYASQPEYSLQDQKNAILQKDTLTHAIKGDWVLKDAQGTVLDKVPNKLVARVPYMTQRGTFIYNGNEWTLASQLRLRSGIYARKKDNGELESHVSLFGNSGKPFRLHMEPDTGVFKIQVGQSHVPIYSLLKALGASDKDVADHWGPELQQTNAQAQGRDHLQKIADRLLSPREKASAAGDIVTGLRTAFARMRLDPDISLRNLGKPHEHVDAATLLRATQKLLHIQQGKEEPDERDNQANQTFHGPEDLFAERISKDSGHVAKSMLWRATHTRNLKHVKAGALTSQLNAVLLQSGLASPLTEVNPVEIRTQLSRVSRMGEGGIPDSGAVPDSARDVQPSQAGFIDPVAGPESELAGVDGRVAWGVKKGSDGLLYQTVLDARTGKQELKAAKHLVDKVVAFPQELDDPTKKAVVAIKGGRLQYVDRDEVDYALPHAENLFSLASNLVPVSHGSKGGRLVMGQRMTQQALPVRDAEAPLVQSVHPDGESYVKKMAEYAGAVTAANRGTVTGVTADGVTVKYDGEKDAKNHELYNHFPFNYATYIHNTPAVKPGDRVESGQLLAKSNYTNDKGELAIGKNLRVAYLPYQKGTASTYEDAIVISEAAAKKLTSEHMKQMKYDPSEEGKHVGLAGFLARFPAVYSREQLSKIGDNGVIKVGSTVQQGDPLVLAVAEKKPTLTSGLHRANKTWHNEDSLAWKYKHEGIVTDVHHGTDGIKVTVKNYRPTEVGDKLSGAYGDKGLISGIIPDDQMPKDEQGRPIEVLLNPLTVISRTNPSQILEALLGKVARKTGQTYKVPATQANMLDFVRDELKKNGLSDTEKVWDPHTNRYLPKVMVGERFFYKLHHVAETKESARDGGQYTAEELPAKGGGEGQHAKRLGLLDLNALISHGATKVIRDLRVVKGQKNDDYWAAVRMGVTPPPVKSPFVYDKWHAYLKGAGINVKQTDTGLQVLAMTDKDVDALSRGAIQNADAVDARTHNPIKGGFFDIGLTGGHHGKNWNHVPLNEALPNPVMEEPIRRLLGMTQKQYEEVIASPNGSAELKDRLAKINVDHAINEQKQVLESGKKSYRADAAKKLGYLFTLQKAGIKPEDLMLSKFPVIPPAFRPITKMNGMQMSSDANYLYQELFRANENWKDAKAAGLNPGADRLNTYNAMKAVAGLMDPTSTKLQDKNIGGLLQHVFGKTTAKHGMFQRRVLSTTLDSVGRAAVIPDPNLDMDHIGIPEKTAWEIYKPFVMRRLARQYNAGDRKTPLTELARWVADKDPRAKAALDDEMQVRPVIINRAPVWHKYGILASWPVLSKGHTIRTSPIINVGLGLDHDGNCLSYHSKVVLEIDKKAMYNWPSSYKEAFMLLFNSRVVTQTEVTSEIVTISIGDFPRCGTPNKDQNGADVYLVPEGVKVYSYDGIRGPGFYPVSKFTVDKNHPCFEVTTRKGRVVEVSSNESLTYFNTATGELDRIKPEACIGKLVPVIVHQTHRGTFGSFDLGWWYGTLIADGWISGHTLGYSKNDKNRRVEFVRLAVDLFGADNSTIHEYVETKTDAKYADSCKIHINNLVRIGEVLDVYEDVEGPQLGRAALRKRIPQQLLDQGSEDTLLGLLSGLLDGDAFLGWNSSGGKRKKPQFICNLHTSSPYLARDIQTLCRLLGLRTSKGVTAATENRAEAYILSISVNDLGKVARKLRLIGPGAEALQEYLNRWEYVRDSFDIIPFTKTEAAELATMAIKAGEATLYSTLRKAVLCGTSGRDSAKRALTIADAQGAGSRFEALALRVNATEVHWDTYTEIKKIEDQDVFDLTVPDTKVFMANDGLIVWDTMNVIPVASDDAVQEAVEKMLPSRNLLAARDFKVHMLPRNEYLHGLFTATQEPDTSKPVRTFRSKEDVLAAYKRGDIGVNDPIKIVQ